MIGQSQVQASGRGSDNAVGNSPGVRRELIEGIGSLSGWYKGVHRKRTKTRRKTVEGINHDDEKELQIIHEPRIKLRHRAKIWTIRWELAESSLGLCKGIEKIAKNIPRDCQRKTVRLFAGNVVGCRIEGVRS
ncbi:hypothetical protein BHM03_00049562 [Ensete ventricosum]|nr:hypothetical protein BHM03_00049562 [Ensete ventricosum]